MGTIAKLIQRSGMDSKVREWLYDSSAIKKADDYFSEGKLEFATSALRNALYKACDATGCEYQFNYEKLKCVLGDILDL
jgi:hypothetical protein